MLLHAGDFTRRGWPDEVEHFKKFLDSLPHEYKVVIAGNHELTFDLENWSRIIEKWTPPYEINPGETKSILDNCIYLEESGCEVLGYKIWGTPWTPTHSNMGFNADHGSDIEAHHAKIPADTEILLSHGPPFGILDMCHHGGLAGCHAL